MAAAFLLTSSALAADPVPNVAPAPGWIEPVTVPSPDAKQSDQPLQFLITSSQEKFSPTGVETYVEYTAVARSTAGLQALGTVTIPWNVERTDLTLHRIALRRGEQTIDLLKPSELLVLRRENQLEKATLDGLRTVVLPAKGLQVGDLLTVAATYRTKPSNIAARPEDIQSMGPPAFMSRLERRFLVPDGVTVRWFRSPGIPEPAVRKLPGATEFRFAATGAKEPEYPVGTPGRFKKKFILVSGWNSWGEIAERMQPLFATARTLESGSSLAAEADKIAATTTDPAARLLAALRLSQEQVRYVALLLGEGAYVPSSAEETWERRFGDCKGKTALLLALLDRFGIEAQPMLVSHGNDDVIGGNLPSLHLFDHVIVRARLAGRDYYLDATDYGQRTLEELSRPAFRYGLLAQAGATLAELKTSVPSAPLRESELVWDGKGGFERKVPFTATLTMRGEVAASMRAKKVASTDREEFETSLKNLMPGVGNDALMIQSDQPEMADGSYVVRFSGSAAMDWSPVDGRRGHRFELDHSTVTWDSDFERSKEPNKDLPLALSWPYYQRATEVILLPRGGKGFKVDAKPIDQKIAGVHITRKVELAGDRIVSRAEFIHLSEEIGAAEARAAESTIEQLNGDYAYVVAPGKIRPIAEKSEE